MSKSKLITIFVFSGIFVLSAIFIPLTFFVFLVIPKLATPSTPTVIMTETRVFVSTEPNVNAKYYIFTITNPENSEIEIVSLTNSRYIDLVEETEYASSFSKAGIYQVRCSVIGEKEESRSDLSDSKQFERYLTLSKPEPNIYSGNSEKILSWESVINANSYDIYFTSSISPTQTYTYTPSTTNVSGIESIYLDTLAELLEFNYGQYQILIVSKNTVNDYYLQSLSSDPINFIYD